MGDKVPGNERSQIEDEIKSLQDVMKRDDMQEIRRHIESLQNASHALSQQIYAQQQQNPQTEAEEDIVEGEVI